MLLPIPYRDFGFLLKALFFALLFWSSNAGATDTVDTVIFGDSASESAHDLTAKLSATATGPSGTNLAQTYRYFTPADPVAIYGGSATFNMAVDPQRRNYFTAKLWGGDDNINDATHKGRLYIYVILDGVEYQLGYRHEGDHMACFANDSPFPSLPGRFIYSTALIPLWMTQGREHLTLKVISSGRIYPLGNGYEGDGGNYQFNMNKNSRGIYRAYTHVAPRLDPSGEIQGTTPELSTRTVNPATSYLGSGSPFFNAVKGQINNRLSQTPSLTNSNFSPEGVEFLAYSYFVSGQINPFQGTLPGYQNAAVVTRVRDLLDLYATNHYANPGDVNDWGGAYGPLGYAVHLLRDQFGSDLDALVNYGTGGSKTRREAWGDLLYASREFGRFNRRTLTNQILIADENLYKANLGLLALGDTRAFTDADAQRYLKEACGLEPWSGPDLPEGGSSYPYGHDYYQVTPKGLSREWGYVGASYGEIVYHVTRFYRMTGNTDFRDQVVKMTKARSYFRNPSVEVSGSQYYPRMADVGFLAWRGASDSDGNGVGADTAYAERPGTSGGLSAAAATLDPALLGYAFQMLEDHQFFNNLTSYNTLDRLDTFADYATVTSQTDSGIRIPTTEGQPDFAWADEENGIVAIKHAGERLWIAPYWQAKKGTAVNGVARFQYDNGSWAQFGTMETTPRLASISGYFVRPALIDKPEEDRYIPPDPPLNAYAGEKLPVGPIPSDATSDDPHRGKADFYALRFGAYLIGLNRSAQSYELRTPSDVAEATDLISSTSLTPNNGSIDVAPESTVVLHLNSETDSAPVPATPLWADVSLGNTGLTINWPASSGADSYEIARSTNDNGPWITLANGITGSSFTDEMVSTGVTYHYRVIARNEHGTSYPTFVVSATGGSGRGVININFAPSASTVMLPEHIAGAPGVRTGNWNLFSGGTLSGSLVNAAGAEIRSLGVSLTNGNSGGFSDRGGSSGNDASMFRTVLDKFDGTQATLNVTGIPYPRYDVLFYVYPDESTSGANDRGGRFTIGSTTYYLRTGSATAVAGPDDYQRSTDTTFTAGSPESVELGNYVRFENLSGDLAASFSAVDIAGGAKRLKVSGFQIVGRPPEAPATLTATGENTQVNLTWSAVSNATTYTLSRATSMDEPFSIISSGLTSTTYTDSNVINGTTYFYLVSALDASGTSPDSPLATATPAAPLTALEQWRLGYFGTISADGNAANEADPDGDGLPNFLEYATGSSPEQASPPALFINHSGAYVTLVYNRVGDPSLTYTIEDCDDLRLANWQPVNAVNNPYSGDAIGEIAVQFTPSTNSSRHFFRLKVSL